MTPSLLDRFSLEGKVALITGGSRGIGAATARAFAAAGADVALTARNKAQLDELADEIRGLGRRVVVQPGDVNLEEVLGELVRAAREQLGRIDIVVNNAGGTPPRPFLDTSTNMFEQAFHFNVTTAFVLSRWAVPHMLEVGGGAIVNISSAMGRLSDRGFAAYGTAKAALAHLTRLSARDLAPRIRVNAIAAGSIATDALSSVLTPELQAEMERQTPLHRLGEPEDIALAALYLASPAGAFITGKIFEVDGGIESPNLALGLPDL